MHSSADIDFKSQKSRRLNAKFAVSSRLVVTPHGAHVAALRLTYCFVWRLHSCFVSEKLQSPGMKGLCYSFFVCRVCWSSPIFSKTATIEFPVFFPISTNHCMLAVNFSWTAHSLAGASIAPAEASHENSWKLWQHFSSMFSFFLFPENERVLGTIWCIYELSCMKSSKMTQNWNFGSVPWLWCLSSEKIPHVPRPLGKFWFCFIDVWVKKCGWGSS